MKTDFLSEFAEVKSPTQNELIEWLISRMQIFVKKLYTQAGESKKLLAEKGIMDDLAIQLRKIHFNPLVFLMESGDDIQAKIRKSFNDIFFTRYFKDYSYLIKRVVLVPSSDNYLHYFITFKSDEIENKFKVNEILKRYKSIGMEKHLKVHFHFINDEILNDIKEFEEINLN